MKILIDPALSVLIKDFTDAQCAELLRCIFEYPNRDCDLGVWQYLKKQIKADEQKYIDKCQRVAYMRQRRQTMRTGLISNIKSEIKSRGQRAAAKRIQIINEHTKKNLSARNIKDQQTVFLIGVPPYVCFRCNDTA